ncbi:MAG: FAD-dependent monooxygenase [Candidatus Dactylopiibacterium sp.]|nr:FAD-dependent monooxygenase [Candidatus Dactylopiibacterium sp.]
MNAAARLSIAISGAGPLGLVSALALARQGHTATLFDARAPAAAEADTRTLALSHGSRELLERLDAWPAQAATPIQRILVSQQGAAGRTRLDAAEHRLPALGYVVGAAALAATLRARVEATGLTIHAGHRLEDATADTQGMRLHFATADGPRLREASLLLRCEGFIPAAEATRCHDYDQHALIARVTPAEPHAALAHERFTARGPLALLPCGSDYALVWTVPAAEAARLMAAPANAWLEPLNAALDGLVRLVAVTERAHHPLGLRMRRHITAPRCVWLGNAAQTLHPVAGQGFNLALRDAWELADTLRHAADPGAPALLARHAARRRLDREGAATFTDLVVRGFSNTLPGLPTLRGLGLTALDLVPPLRHFVARRMIYGARAWP